MPEAINFVDGRRQKYHLVGKVSAHYIALLIYTCFCAYTIHARSTTNGKIRREIQNPQMLETDPESFSPAIYFSFVIVFLSQYNMAR
jgi:hypothetical protein